MGNAFTVWVASKVIRKRDGPNSVSTTLVTSRAHGCECGSGGSRGCYGMVWPSRKRLTIHLEGEMAIRVIYEDYHGFEDCNVMILFMMILFMKNDFS